MQFTPELYPVSDFKFIPTSSLGIIAREYEVTQLVQLLQTMDKQSPMYPQLLEAIIDHMNISNREELIATLRQSSQPNPQQQQIAQQQAQMQMAQLQAQTAAFQAQAQESASRAQKYTTETSLLEYEAQTDRIKALSNQLEPGVEDDKEFERRARIAEIILKERDIQTRERNNGGDQNRARAISEANQQQVQQAGQPTSGIATTASNIPNITR